MDAGEAGRFRLQGERQHFRPGAEAMEPDRGVDADTLVAVSEQSEQLLLGDDGGERLGEDCLGGLVDVRGDVHAPDRALAVERIAADPIGEVGPPIGCPGHADAHQTLVDHAQFLLTEGISVGDEREGVHLAFRELVQDEMSAQVAVEGMTWLEEEAGGSVGVVGDRRGDREGLVGRTCGHPHVLLDPAALDGLILVLVPPPAVRPLEQVHQPFTFPRLVAVIIDADHVAEGVEGDFLGVAEAAGEDLEAATVRLATQDGAFMREEESPAFLAGDIPALVADGPIDASVRPEPQPVHVVSGISDVSAETRRDDFLHVRHAVPVGVLEAPDVRDRGQVDPAVEIEHAGGDAGDRRIESFGEDGELVGDAVAIGVRELVDAFLVVGQVLPVDRPVLVMVFQAAARRLQPAGRQFLLVESEFLFRRRQADVIGDPDAMLADVEVARLATGRRGHISVAGFVKRHRSRVGHVEVSRPLERLHLGADARGG